MVIQNYDIRHLFPTPSYGYDIERYRGGREIMRSYRRGRGVSKRGRPSARWLEIQSMERARLAQLEQQKAREEAEQKRFEQEQLQKAFEVGRQMEERRKAEEPKQTFLQRQARFIAGISGPFLPLKAAQQFGLGEEIKLPPKVEKAEEVRRGFTYELIPKTKEEVAITAATFGLGAGIRAGVGVGGAAVTRFAPRAAPIVSKVALGAGIGLGTGIAFGKGVEVVTAPTAEAKGEIIGKATREFGAFGAGYGAVGYGVRRFTLSRQLTKQAERLMPHERALYESQLAEAKAYAKIQPVVKELKLAEVEYIPPKAVKPLGEFIKGRPRLIVGGRCCGTNTALC